MKIVVLTGAGMSAESGIKTFRDADGLWEGHDVMEVASPEGWRRNRALVLDFYNQRRAQLYEVEPNIAHRRLVDLEQKHDVHVITQNVDDLHERAGSSKVLHLHGELRKVRSISDPTMIYPWMDDLNDEDRAADGSRLRPHIVWFGEAVPMMDEAIQCITSADVVIVIGTSMQVYPAAGLVEYAPIDVPVYYIDPRPHLSHGLQQRRQLHIMEENATVGVDQLVRSLME